MSVSTLFWLTAGIGVAGALIAPEYPVRMVMVDAQGRWLEVILLDRGHGPEQWIRASTRHGYLIGPGYYRTAGEVLALVDVVSLVEVIQLKR